jgi:hypothetical protein
MDIFNLSYDFSNSLGELVLSIPGFQKEMGHERIQQLVSEMKFVNFPKYIRCQCSSLGKPNLTWINQLNGSLRGSPEPIGLTNGGSLQFLYPSKSTVKNSKYPQLSNQFFFNSYQPYPFDLLHGKLILILDCISLNNTLMHSKIIICTDSLKYVYIVTKEELATGYIYCGSHNISQAALGSKSKTEKNSLKYF